LVFGLLQSDYGLKLTTSLYPVLKSRLLETLCTGYLAFLIGSMKFAVTF